MRRISFKFRRIWPIAALFGAIVLCSQGRSYGYGLTFSYTQTGGIYSYNYTGILDQNEFVDHLTLWMDLDWNADNDGVLESGESFEITGVPAGWSGVGSHLSTVEDPLGNGTTYDNKIEWTYNGGFPGLAGPATVSGFQIQSYLGPGNPGGAAYEWANGAGINGITDGPEGSIGVTTNGVPSAPVPEPGTMFLMISGLAGIVGGSRLRRNKR